jgi:DNA invertase Pin-like site-specific DNA recombinase
MSPAHFGRFVAYYRVSTDKQGRSGLGLEAQKAAVARRLDGGPWRVVESCTEVESGRRKARPGLAKALAACKKHKAKLVVAKLDRLSRDVKFLLTLVDSGVEVLFCDLPDMGSGAMARFMLTQMAAVAELEAGLISERTKAALAAAKQRGVRLGVTGAARAARFKAEAAARAAELAPVLRELKEKGMSLRGIAAELTKRQVRTLRGGAWHPQLVARVLERLEVA